MGSEVTFKIRVGVKRQAEAGDFERLEKRLAELPGFLGAHEATVLSERAQELGFETEAWVLDAAEAPSHRDWVAGLSEFESELYFDRESNALHALKVLSKEFPSFLWHGLERVEPQDWDAQWKASYQGVSIDGNWLVLPDWKRGSAEALESAKLGRKVIFLTPGAGFGTGTHETTQLCLRALSEQVKRLGSLEGLRVLDFGSGSGILALAAAMLGAQVDAVEIDPLAIDNAKHNLGLNALKGSVSFHSSLKTVQDGVDGVLANILRPVLIDHRDAILSLMRPSGAHFVILSGMVETDIPEVRQRYWERLFLLGKKVQVTSLNEWRSIVFS